MFYLILKTLSLMQAPVQDDERLAYSFSVFPRFGGNHSRHCNHWTWNVVRRSGGGWSMYKQLQLSRFSNRGDEQAAVLEWAGVRRLRVRVLHPRGQADLLQGHR